VIELGNNKRRYLSWVVLAGMALAWQRHRSRRRYPQSHVSAKDAGFIKRAVLLEAQQVPFYHQLALQARRTGRVHLEAGFLKAMEVEADHLRDLKVAGRRLGIKLMFWEQLGERIGGLTGSIATKLDPRVGLLAIRNLESVAAREYARARRQVADTNLQQLYLSNQLDEEIHQAWAALMLKSSEQGQLE
jgi:hypothetical protein